MNPIRLEARQIIQRALDYGWVHVSSLPPKTDADYRREYHRNYMRDRRAKLHAAGLTNDGRPRVRITGKQIPANRS